MSSQEPKTNDQLVAELVERVHAYDEDGDRGDGLIDDLLDFSEVSLDHLARHLYKQEQPPAPGAPLLNRVMEGVDVAKASTASALWVLIAGNTLQAQLPEWGPYRDRYVQETLKREKAGELEEGHTGRLCMGFLEKHNYLWLIENDPEHAATWVAMADRNRISLEGTKT